MTNQPETAVTVDALARMLSAADVEINHGDYPTWDTLAESGQKQYRQAARYLLKRLHITAPAAVSAAVAPPTQAAPSLRAGLRDEIVKALGRITTVPPVAHRREQADHVLAVLYREWPWLRAEAEDDEPTDRAAVLRWAADAIDAETRQAKADGVLEPDKYRPCRDASAQLRRMADETATQTPAADATHPCNAATMHRLGNLATAHGPHLWVMQPDMDPVRCPGTREPAAPCTCQYIAESWIQMDHAPDCPAAGARQDGAET